MNTITLTQLSYVVALARTRNFGRAAKTCFVSQPTLSMQIQKLEDELDVILFDRSRKPVEPTLIGHKIVKQAQAVLREAQRIEELIKAEKGEIGGEFKLGVIPTLAPYLLPLFLKSFVNRFPKIDLILEELQTWQIMEKLRNDSLDAGILVTPLHGRGIVERPLFYEPFVIYLAPGHPLHSLPKISEKDLSLEDIWLLNEGHCFREQAIELCKKVKSRRFEGKNLLFESGNLETLKRLVDKKFGYTLLPWLAVLDMPARERKRKLKFFKAPVPTREVSLVYSRSFLKRNIIEALFKAIVSSVPRELKNRPLKSRVVGLSSFS
ncbi:MAG: hydrogen peroxide-inducible genes activator [Nitrospinaceae bacterium]